jgi:hypothetical protein
MTLQKSIQSLTLFALSLPAAVMAAGGHHAVDDAAMLATGNCKLDGWWAAGPSAARSLRAGAGCRVGAVELGVGTERLRDHGDTSHAHGVQVKWAHELQPGVGVGWSLAPSWQGRSAQAYQGSVVMGLLSWEAGTDFHVHLNLGRQVRHRDRDDTAGGVSLDWRLSADWQGMVERYRVDGQHLARAGLRWTPVKGWTLDASRAQSLSGPSGPTWTWGVTREFE